MHNTAWENGQRVSVVEFATPSFDAPITRRDRIGCAPVPAVELDHALFQRLTAWVSRARTRREFTNRRLAVEWCAWPGERQESFAIKHHLNPSRFATTVGKLKRHFIVKH